MYYICSDGKKNFSSKSFDDARYRFDTVEEAMDFIRKEEVEEDLRDMRLAMKNKNDRDLYSSRINGAPGIYEPYQEYYIYDEIGDISGYFHVDYQTYLYHELRDFSSFVDLMFSGSTSVDERGNIEYWTPDHLFSATYPKEDMEEYCRRKGITDLEDIDQSDYEEEDNKALMSILLDLHEEWVKELKDVCNL